jgi:DNA-binding response OmpR family regulator
MSHEELRAGDAPPAPTHGPGGLRVDLATRRAYAGPREIALTKQLFDVLAYLLAHQGRVVPNSELVRAVWEHEVVGDRHFLQTVMYRLRVARSAAQATDPIEVVRGVGYTIGRS